MPGSDLCTKYVHLVRPSQIDSLISSMGRPLEPINAEGYWLLDPYALKQSVFPHTKLLDEIFAIAAGTLSSWTKSIYGYDSLIRILNWQNICYTSLPSNVDWRL